MMITKFNKMIRNKVVWWIIGSIVIITFVGWFSPHGGCDYSAPAGVGSLDGQPVSDAELRQARFNTYMGLCLNVGRIVTITPRLDRELRAQAWKRVAALRAAREMQLTASPEEVLATLKRDPQFQEANAFSRQRYQAFCQNVLGALNASVSQFEAQVAENIILQKLHAVAGSAAWITPGELAVMAGRYADAFQLSYVTLGTNSIKASEVTVSDTDCRAFYDQHTNLFLVPPKVAVRYLALPASQYTAKAASQVDTNAIDEYYASHGDQFSTTDTNGTATLLPLDQVSSVISNRLLHDAGLQLARDAVNDLANALVPDRDGKAATLEEVAAKAGVPVSTTALFDATAEVAGIDAGLAFNQAAFRLRPTADEYFSDAVAGSNMVYLLCLQTNTEAYIPEFGAIRDQVKPLARAKAVEDALEKKAGELHAFLAKGLAAKRTFTELAQERGLPVSTTQVFSASSAPDELSSPEILSDISLRNTGELSSVLPGANGLVIAYITERKGAGAEELASVQNQVAMSVIRRRARLLFSDWEAFLVSGGRMKDNAPIGEPADATADDTP